MERLCWLSILNIEVLVVCGKGGFDDVGMGMGGGMDKRRRWMEVVLDW